MQADRVVTVPVARLRPWLANFARRHGEPRYAADATTLSLSAPDGAAASIAVPWLPWPAAPDPDALATHLAVPRRFGVLLARKTAHAVGIVTGDRLEASAVDRHYVQGRTKAGGWSQQRYARRRSNQAKAAFADAADDVLALLVPEARRLDYLVTGGEQTAVTAVLADPRLAALQPVRARSPQRAWPTPDPRQAVLVDFIEVFQALTVTLNELA